MTIKKIEVGSNVYVNDPNGSIETTYMFGFSGSVIDIMDNGNLIVMDQDSDCFEVDPKEVELD